eukprot:4085877-Ditylum_brightwellii.AAC.1
MIPPILDTFIQLSPPNLVSVYPIKLTSSSTGFGGNNPKPPIVRCIEQSTDASFLWNGGSIQQQEEGEEEVKALEITNVDSVDKVYRILTKYMGIK